MSYLAVGGALRAGVEHAVRWQAVLGLGQSQQLLQLQCGALPVALVGTDVRRCRDAASVADLQARQKGGVSVGDAGSVHLMVEAQQRGVLADLLMVEQVLVLAPRLAGLQKMLELAVELGGREDRTRLEDVVVRPPVSERKAGRSFCLHRWRRSFHQLA